MRERANLYKEISIRIIDKLNNKELDKVELLLDERQVLLEEENSPSELKKILINDGILDIDNSIHKLLSENIDKIKIEIKNHRMSKQANNSYMGFNQKKINIFNEKV